MRLRLTCLLLLSSVSLWQGLSAAVPPREPQLESRLRKAFRRPTQNGWIFVHLEGTPWNKFDESVVPSSDDGFVEPLVDG